MGVCKKSKTDYTEREIQKILENHFLSPSTKKYEIENLFVYMWESDYLALTKSGYAYECEIKVSRADFARDKKKKEDKFTILEESTNKARQRPNYFFYVVPDNLIKPEEVPDYAGLIYIKSYFPFHEIVKQPTMLHDEKYDVNELGLIDKFYYNMRNWKQKGDDANLSDLRKQVRSLEKTIMDYDDMLSERTEEIEDLKKVIKEYESKDKNIINS